jgi:hypothetical protein
VIYCSNGAFTESQRLPSLMSATYDLVKYNAKYRERILELQTLLWHSDLAINNAYFRWKYEENPYSEEPVMALAITGERVAGVLGMYGTAWTFGTPASPLAAMCIGDLAIAEDHRRAGLFSPIVQLAFEEMRARDAMYTWTLSASPITFLLCRSMGWRSIPLELLESSSRGLQSYYRSLRGLLAGMSVVASRTPRPESMAALVERLGGDDRIRHLRDDRYYAWRYRDPLSDYHFWFKGGHQLDGYLVTQQPRYRDGAYTIVDWEAADRGTAAALLMTALRDGPQSGMQVWSQGVPRKWLPLLRSAGFVSLASRGQPFARYQPMMLLRSLDDQARDLWSPGGLDLLDLSNWDLRMVYSDGN